VAALGQTYRLRRDIHGDRPPTKTRPCLRCRKPFESEGIHHRLCLDCNNRLGDLSPYAL
jgi:hypothetical protein